MVIEQKIICPEHKEWQNRNYLIMQRGDFSTLLREDRSVKVFNFYSEKYQKNISLFDTSAV